MSVLLIDVGNTRAKWLLQTGSIEQGGALSLDEEANLGWLEEITDLNAIEQVCIATVADIPNARALCEQTFGSRLLWLDHPRADCDSFTHCYNRPERLGVDRWLAMIGARQLSEGNLMVVDLGTALKIDLLSAENHHLGGYIVPGFNMAQQSLWRNTDKVIGYSDELDAFDVVPGQSTVECVGNGIRRQVLSMVRDVKQDYPDFHVLVSGGDGAWLAEKLELAYLPDLVFEGMRHICAGSF